MKTVNPATGETIRTYQEMDPAGVEHALDEAHLAFLEWRCSEFEARARLMQKAASLLRERSVDLARLMA